MINTTTMKFARLTISALIAISLTSCSTLASLMNSSAFRILDQTGSALMGYLGDNTLPANGKPQSIEERARQVQSEGLYAGGVGGKALPVGKVAAR
jgi:hypothetical protein|uniref:hypothetical protein n=1 Tax=Prosthecobacter sp. TaxID=1965333 RepID=UPI00378434EB